MINNISLTIRLPHELNTKLTAIAKDLGITKTNLIRSAIHELLTDDNTILDFSCTYSNSNKKDRLVLNVNQLTYNILEDSCKKYNQSMNAVVTAISFLSLQRSSKRLQSIRN